MLNISTLSSTITTIETAEPKDEDQWRISYLASLWEAKFTPQEKNIDYAGNVDGFQF